MITAYVWTTPNGEKIPIALEELGLPYKLRGVNLGRGEQHTEAFLEISPNGKIPALVDPDGPGGREVRLFESGAILLYLAEKAGGLLPADPGLRWEAVQWLFWQTSGLGPYWGQAFHFNSPPARDAQADYGRERYCKEAKRLIGVADKRLADRDFLAVEFSVADVASWPWLRKYDALGIDLDPYPHVAGWLKRVAERPAVSKGRRRLREIQM